MVSLGKLCHLSPQIIKQNHLYEDKGVVLHWSHCEVSNVYMLWRQNLVGIWGHKNPPQKIINIKSQKPLGTVSLFFVI